MTWVKTHDHPREIVLCTYGAAATEAYERELAAWR
jgi:hypothetical protein